MVLWDGVGPTALISYFGMVRIALLCDVIADGLQKSYPREYAIAKIMTKCTVMKNIVLKYKV